MKSFYILSILFFTFCSSPQPIDKNLDTVSGFTPIKDDEFAKRYAPSLESGSIHGDPFAIYYRASKDLEGNTHITYHYFWEKEENTGSGMGPFFNRNIYTGGIKLQKSMFGKGDIEMVSFMIDKSGKIQQVEYETAENYEPNKFGVKHKHVERNGFHKEPVLFKVISWNHLFDYIGDNTINTPNTIRLIPQYFNQSLWEEYAMVKEKESFLSRNRAHKPYEKEFIE
ncbi:MAG: hypothetical protein IPL26_18975 [Leptospiraceae bacterium]|nr:hypothetical protein [Leptospiraceae bacterium]